MVKAAAYVQSLLPAPQTGPISTDWVFIPSAELGGDAFGYHWLDDDHFAMYLLDVCGHGIGAALHSVSVLNVLRAQTLRDTDFYQPSDVLAALKLAVHPLLVWALATHAFDVEPLHRDVAVVLAAMPVGANVYLLAARYAVGTATTSTSIFRSTG